ncbi:MAG: hypothetical protein R3F33_14795 [Planctomycetota bacterium]
MAEAAEDTPLSPRQRVLCAEAGERLRSALGRLYRAIPSEQRTVRGTAEALGLDRNLVQRAFRASRMDLPAEYVLVEAPGILGLEKIAGAAEAAGIERATCDGLQAAIAGCRDLLTDLGGSQKALIRRIQADMGAAPKDHTFPARQARFLADREIFGTSEDMRFAAFLFRPKPDQPELMEHANASGRFGLRRADYGVPLSGYYKATPEARNTVEITDLWGADVQGAAPYLILEPFTTSPLPKIVCTNESGLGVHVLDSPALLRGEPIDYFVARKISPAGIDPRREEDARITQRISLRHPSALLVFDVWVHREYADAGQVFGGQFIKGPDDTRNPRERWYDRVPVNHSYTIETLTIERADCADEPRAGAMVNYMFQQLGWDPSEFVGYRYTSRYPLVGVDHVISLEFQRE